MSENEADPETGEVLRRHLRIVEALLFASAEPLRPSDIAPYLGEGVDVRGLLLALQAEYAGRGVNLVPRGEG